MEKKGVKNRFGIEKNLKFEMADFKHTDWIPAPVQAGSRPFAGMTKDGQGRSDNRTNDVRFWYSV